MCCFVITFGKLSFPILSIYLRVVFIVFCEYALCPFLPVYCTVLCKLRLIKNRMTAAHYYRQSDVVCVWGIPNGKGICDGCKAQGKTLLSIRIVWGLSKRVTLVQTAEPIEMSFGWQAGVYA